MTRSLIIGIMIYRPKRNYSHKPYTIKKIYTMRATTRQISRRAAVHLLQLFQVGPCRSGRRLIQIEPTHIPHTPLRGPYYVLHVYVHIWHYNYVMRQECPIVVYICIHTYVYVYAFLHMYIYVYILSRKMYHHKDLRNYMVASGIQSVCVHLSAAIQATRFGDFRNSHVVAVAVLSSSRCFFSLYVRVYKCVQVHFQRKNADTAPKKKIQLPPGGSWPIAPSRTKRSLALLIVAFLLRQHFLYWPRNSCSDSHPSTGGNSANFFLPPLLVSLVSMASFGRPSQASSNPMRSPTDHSVSHRPQSAISASSLCTVQNVIRQRPHI